MPAEDRRDPDGLADDRGDPAILRRVLAREALDVGDAATALRWIDELPAAEQPDWLASVWMLAGSARALRANLDALSPTVRPVVDAWLASPPRRVLPRAEGADAYDQLDALANDLAAKGRAAELTVTHLAMAEVAPRPDWSAIHIEHAGSLALGLDDARLSALVRAHEARRDLRFGELDDAREAATAAIAMGRACDAPEAIELAEAVLAELATLPPPPDAHTPPPDDDASPR